MKPKRNAILFYCMLGTANLAFALDLSQVPKPDWIQMFNGKDLDGFKTLEILDLAGCKDPKASNHREYFVKADASERVHGTPFGDADAFAKRGAEVRRIKVVLAGD